MNKETKEVIYILAALTGFYWRYLWAALRTYADVGSYQFGWMDILTAALFVIIVWAFPAVKDIIRKGAKR